MYILIVEIFKTENSAFFLKKAEVNKKCKKSLKIFAK
jgi:hypothetical protein